MKERVRQAPHLPKKEERRGRGVVVMQVLLARSN
jgi:hypothetical protein